MIADNKKEDPVSQAFIQQFIYLSEDMWCNPINIFLSVPIWSRKENYE